MRIIEGQVICSAMLCKLTGMQREGFGVATVDQAARILQVRHRGLSCGHIGETRVEYMKVISSSLT